MFSCVFENIFYLNLIICDNFIYFYYTFDKKKHIFIIVLKPLTKIKIKKWKE